VERRYKIAVLGSARLPDVSPVREKAAQIGRAVARQQGTLITGGCSGLPQEAVRGALSLGGLTVAISPALNRDEHVHVYAYPLDSDLYIFTGMGTKGRNVILVRSADACVFIGGGMGTLNEFTIAFDDLGPKNAVGILSGSGGLSDEFPKLAATVDGPGHALLVVESDPQALTDKLFEHIRSFG
jgi:uncharacterized protein (TIGR00725 family)